MNFLSPFSLLWLLPIGGVIVGLYVLKLRRREQIVSSTFLWAAVVQDTQANAPFQKLRRNLLLLLQMLAVLALVLSLARPFLWASGLGGATNAIVIDASASMKATDEPGSRFDAAVAQARTLIKQKAPGDQAVVVIAGAGQPVPLTPLTADGDKLLRALDDGNKVHATDAPGDMREAVMAAASLVSSRAGAQVTVISDGVWGKLDEMTLGGVKLQYLPVGKRSENVGITAFDVRDSLLGDANRQAFVTVQNFGKTPRTFPLEIRSEDKLIDAHEVTLAPGQSKSETFDQLAAKAGGIVSARIEVKDDLASDDGAALTLAPRRTVKILLVSDGNTFLERALNTDPRVALDAVAPGAFKPTDTTTHDLTVFDNVAVPKDLPENGRYLIWGGSAAGPVIPATITGADADKPSILDWSRTHPLMRFVDLANVQLLRARPLAAAPWATTIAESSAGPLIVAGEKGEGRSVFVGFPVLDSNMPLRIAFPIFLANCIDWLTTRAGDTGGLFHPGEIVPLAARPDAGDITIVRPDRGKSTVRAAGGTAALYNGADTVGIYDASGAGNFKQKFAVSLLSPTESNIAPAATPGFLVIDEATGESRPQAATRVPVRREIWPWIAGALLAILTLEWFVYHRRIG